MNDRRSDKRRATDRLLRNSRSKATADHDGQPWTSEELDWLQSWDGTEAYLAELAEMLGRTIEACREKFYKARRSGWSVTETITMTKADGSSVSRSTTYRGWTESDGDGW